MNSMNLFDAASTSTINSNNTNIQLNLANNYTPSKVVNTSSYNSNHQAVVNMNSSDYIQDKYYSIIEEENRQKLKLQVEQEKERLKSLMPNITTFNLNDKSVKDDYDTTSTTNNLISNGSSNTNNNNNNTKIPIINITMPITPPSLPLLQTTISNNVIIQNQQQYFMQQQHQQQQQHPINSTISNNYYLSDANKAFDDVVFDILKVDPDYIAGQLTLIDVPLFKAIEPDELISCKWMSREKLAKAPNIVQFTRRFNQTTFWAQKEILNCRRIEKRGKMITHFIKMAKRLNELHSFNCLMAIIVALKSAPIFRLKKTWSQHVSKRDTSQFERLADLMFDTSDNKRKIRDMHMNVKLPCIPFLGLFLTDLIHIDIAHPHNSFDNPQRRNQMNNICRLISEFQQSNYQDLTSISCSCTFSSSNTSPQEVMNSSNTNNNHDGSSNLASGATSSIESAPVCISSNCSCGIHHGDGYGSGIINSDGTIYISEIGYVQNYLNSFLYIEELQKFKEDENYRDSLELEPEPSSVPVVSTTPSSSLGAADHVDSKNNDSSSTTTTTPPPPLNFSTHNTSSPNKLFLNNESQNLKLNLNTVNNLNVSSSNSHRFKLNNGLTSYNSVVATAGAENNNSNNLVLNYYHRKSLSLNNNNLLNETKEFLNELKLRHHPLDDSIVESTSNLPVLISTTATTTLPSLGNPNEIVSSHNLINTTNNINNELTNVCLNLNLTKEQQKQILNSVKLNDPPSLLKELLKHRHNVGDGYNNNNNNVVVCQHNKSHRKSSGHNHHRNKFNCYSGNATSSDCDCECDDVKNEENTNKNNNEDLNNNLNQLNGVKLTSTPHGKKNGAQQVATAVGASPNLKKLNESLKTTHQGTSSQSNESSDGENNNTISNSTNTTSSNNNNNNNRRISGRNLIKVLNESEKVPNATTTNQQTTNNNFNTANSLTTSTISYGNNLENSLNSMSNTNDECQSNDINLSNNVLINNLLLQTSIIQFESPIKRKCIIKNFRKPRFSQWKSYWLQLVGGNLLIYYPAKTIVFNRGDSMASQRRSSTNSNEFYTDSVSSAITALAATSINTTNELNIIDEELKQQQTQQLQNQLQARKVYYHKNPCKMHPIASWMVVNLYQDKENEILSALVAKNVNHQQSSVIAAAASNMPQPPQLNHTKFDIQLNDLNNGNMYKYRLDSLPLAKEWLEHFKTASTYHERQKPDNLIRFD